MAVTIVNDIYLVLTSGAAMDYDVVPDAVLLRCLAGHGSSHSAAVAVVEGHLALAASRVPLLYEHCYKGLFQLLCPDLTKAESAILNDETAEPCSHGACLSCVLLLLNPELATGWNYRKRLIIANEVNVTFELWLTAFVLKKHPRSNETFSHRRWVLTHQGREQQQAPHLPASASVFAAEATICEEAARRYHSNYNAWSHRQWAFVSLVSGDRQHALSKEEREEVLLGELASTLRFCDEFVSDYCGFHYRQYLLAQIQDSAARLHFLLDELANVTKAMRDIGMNFESLWYHRRAVIRLLFQTRVGMAEDDNQRVLIARTMCSDERLGASTLLSDSHGRSCPENRSSDRGGGSSSGSSWPAALLGRHLRWLDQLASRHWPCTPATSEADQPDGCRASFAEC